MFGYIKEKSTGNLISYFDIANKPEDTDVYEFIECKEEDKPELYKQPLPEIEPSRDLAQEIDDIKLEISNIKKDVATVAAKADGKIL